MASWSGTTLSPEKRAQDFTLPNAVKELLDAEIKYAIAAAITILGKMALFATALMTLAHMVSGNDTNTVLWGILRFFTYSAITLSLGGTFLSLACANTCPNLPHRARQSILQDSNSWPARIARGETLPRELLMDSFQMLREFGIPQQFWIVHALLTMFLLIGPMFSVLAVAVWIWLTETYANAGSTMVTIVPAFLGIIHAIWIGF